MSQVYRPYMSNAIELPREGAVQAATSALGSAKSVFALMGFLDGVVTLGMLTVIRQKADAGHLAGLGFWLCILGAITMRLWRRVKLVRGALATAQTSTRTTWLLDGRTIIGVEGGIPQLDLSFKISNTVRNVLVAVPQARVVER